MKDIVYSDIEISIAVNKLERHQEELITAMEKYCNILSDVQKDGIREELICSKLSKIALEVTAIKRNMMLERNELSKKTKSAIEKIEKADTFEFPTNKGLDIVRILESIF